MEKLIKNRIVDHLEENKLIKESQHGFRAKRSCLTNLLDFFGTVMNVYDKEQAVDIVYLDFQKAFDKVPHERLMRKVEALGITGAIAQWLRTWLQNRKQRVCIGDARSGWTSVTSGVPQGSVLGPLLFIIYINDLDTNLVSKVSKFADDTKLCHRAVTDIVKQAIQGDLRGLMQWADD